MSALALFVMPGWVHVAFYFLSKMNAMVKAKTNDQRSFRGISEIINAFENKSMTAYFMALCSQ